MAKNKLVKVIAAIASIAVLLCLAKREKKEPERDEGMFGHIDLPEQPRELLPGVAVRKFFSPSIIVFLSLSFLIALFNLLLENLL